MNPTNSNTTDPRRNQLLAALPAAEWECWKKQLEEVHLPQGMVISEARSVPAHMVFPVTAVVSLMCWTNEGASTEVAVVGNEGVVGLALLLGGADTANQAVVQNAGQGYRLPGQVVRDALARGGAVSNLLLGYARTVITQVAQVALCNRHHSIEQQLCRRLLVGLDRSPCDELAMTHEVVAGLLGVRRESVTGAAFKLQQAGVIRYWRGHIEVLDRKRLEQGACECYAAARPDCVARRQLALAA